MSDAAYSNEKALWHGDKIAALRRGELIVPAQVQLILSDLCNQDCHFCSYRMSNGLSTEQFGEPRADGTINMNPNRKIPTARAQEILRDCASVGVKAIQFTGGGEPTVHPDHMQLFGLAMDLGMEAALVTNLVRLQPGWRDVLPRMSWIRASVDAGSSETYSSIRRVPSNVFKQVMNHIATLAQQLAWSGSKCLFGVGFVVTPENWREIVPAVKILRESGAHYVRLSAMFSKDGIDPFNEIHPLIWEEVCAAMELQTDTFKVVNLYADRITDMVLQAPSYSFCGYQQFNVYIGGNLKVYRCCTTAYTLHGEVGDLSAQSFAQWLRSAQRAKAHGEFDARTCSICQFNYKNEAIDRVVNGPEPTHVNFV